MLSLLLLSCCAFFIPSVYPQVVDSDNRIGRGIGPDAGWQALQAYRNAALAPNATGNFTADVYVYNTAATQRILSDPYNATDPYALAVSLNATLVSPFNASYNVSTLNQVLELTVSEDNIQRMASQGRRLRVIFLASFAPAQSSGSDGSCDALLGADCAAALAQGYNLYDDEAGADWLPPANITACANISDSDIYFSTFTNPSESFYSNVSSLNFTASNPDAAGFYNETQDPRFADYTITTRFNQSGFGHGFGFATRSALFHATSIIGPSSNTTAYQAVLQRVNLVVVQERLLENGFDPAHPSWTSIHCVRANMTVGDASRRPVVTSSAPAVTSSAPVVTSGAPVATSSAIRMSRPAAVWTCVPVVTALTATLFGSISWY